MTDNVHSLLAAHRFSRNFPPDVLDRLTEVCSIKTFTSGEFIFRQDQDASFFFLILEGKVDIELFSTVGGPVVLQTLAGGDALGWSWLISPFHWSADARVVENTRVLSFDASNLRVFIERDHEFGYRLLSQLVPVLASRLESANLRLLNIYGAHS